MIKKLLYFAIILLIFPFVVLAETCDTNSIVINSIDKIEDTSNGKDTNTESVTNGSNIKLDIGFADVDEYVIYEINISNTSDEDYQLNDEFSSINSDYVNYKIEFPDNSNQIKANTSKTIRLIVQYNKAVPLNSFTGDTYNNAKTLSINLSNGELIDIPDLDNNMTPLYIFIIVLWLTFGLLVILHKKKTVNCILFLLLTLMVVHPMTTHSLCNICLKVEANVEVKKFNGRSIYNIL